MSQGNGRLTFNKQISIGNILEILTFVVVGIGAFYHLQTNIAVAQVDRNTIKTEQIEIKKNLNKVDADSRLTRLETILEIQLRNIEKALNELKQANEKKRN